MAFILPHEMKNILKLFDSESSSFEAESKPFPFFDLPDLVIYKIVKEYVPILDKVGTLSQIRDFHPYLELTSPRFQRALELFQLVGSIKSGWYMECGKLPTLYHFSVNYIDLNVTLHIFDIQRKNCKLAKQYKKSPQKRSVIFEKFMKFKNSPLLNFVKENEFFVYMFKHQYYIIYFWIFRPQKMLRCSMNYRLYRLRNNTCSMLFKEEYRQTRRLTVILEEDFTVEVHCQLSIGNFPYERFFTTLRPLNFQPCAEKHSYEFDHKLWECQSCKRGSNYVHPVVRQTFLDFDKDDISEVTTLFYVKDEWWKKYFDA